MRRVFLSASAVLFLCALGCSRGAGPKTEFTVARPEAIPAAPAAAAAAGQAQPQEGAAKERKIKYTADVKVICDDLDQAAEGLKGALKKHKALVAHSDVVSSPGSARTGQWRVRLPVAEFDAFRDAVLTLGEVEKNTSDSEDLTEEYVDLEAHIKNRQAEEESLRQLLEKSGDKLDTILTLRRELATVRDEINRKQARLKLLANLTELTTVNVTLRERQRFVPEPPPARVEAATFGMRLSRTFQQSVDALTAAVQAIVLVLVALAPWLPVALAVGVPAVWLYRRRARVSAPLSAGPAPGGA